jgi:glucose-6-phosphate 1-epimerase
MSQEITLQNGELTAVISSQGAWLERLDNNGQPALYPKQILETQNGDKKARGGCHVCLPNFGPNKSGNLPQHGFGREMLWRVGDCTESGVTLHLDHGEDGYESLASTLRYEVLTDGVEMRLLVTNEGDVPLHVAPGFHPYFPCADAEMEIDGEPYLLDELREANFLEHEPKVLQTDAGKYELQAEGLRQWVAWSDGLGAYVCLEPTDDGYAFMRPPTGERLLQPGAEKHWKLIIRKLS